MLHILVTWWLRTAIINFGHYKLQYCMLLKLLLTVTLFLVSCHFYVAWIRTQFFNVGNNNKRCFHRGPDCDLRLISAPPYCTIQLPSPCGLYPVIGRFSQDGWSQWWLRDLTRLTSHSPNYRNRNSEDYGKVNHVIPPVSKVTGQETRLGLRRTGRDFLFEPARHIRLWSPPSLLSNGCKWWLFT
jgi:hypothetical protein